MRVGTAPSQPEGDIAWVVNSWNVSSSELRIGSRPCLRHLSTGA